MNIIIQVKNGSIIGCISGTSLSATVGPKAIHDLRWWPRQKARPPPLRSRLATGEKKVISGWEPLLSTFAVKQQNNFAACNVTLAYLLNLTKYPYRSKLIASRRMITCFWNGFAMSIYRSQHTVPCRSTLIRRMHTVPWRSTLIRRMYTAPCRSTLMRRMYTVTPTLIENVYYHTRVAASIVVRNSKIIARGVWKGNISCYV